MYKKLPQENKKNVANKDVSTEGAIIPPVDTALSAEAEQPIFALVAASSVPPSLPAQALIFAMQTKATDLESTIILSHQNLAKFLTHVGHGEQNEAENMLKQDPSLSLKFGDLTDCAKKEFKKVSAFQYALWALDFHMWQMILKYLPDKEAKQQCLGLERGQWIQSQQNQSNWQNLIDALQIYVDNYDVWSYDKLKNYWSQIVGGEQRLVPAHVISEYNHPLRSFYSHLPDDYQIVLPRTSTGFWGDADLLGVMQLGVNFAWSRGDSEKALSQLCSNSENAVLDKNYLNALLLFRREQARMLIFVLSHKPQATSHKPQATSHVIINDCKFFKLYL